MGSGFDNSLDPISDRELCTSFTTSGSSSPSVLSSWVQSWCSSPEDVTSSMVVSPVGDMYRVDGFSGEVTREDHHLYSMAISRGILYTGSDSRSIHMWKNMKELPGFKTGSRFVKTIVISNDRMFTGHGDGKVRIWRMSQRDMSFRIQTGSLPSVGDSLKTSLNPKNYVMTRRHKRTLRIRHFDAVSCLSLNEHDGILYSSSWDKSFKVWRIADSKCLDSIDAHDDAVNSIVTGFCDLVLTGSADGTVKAWRRENQCRRKKTNIKEKQKTRHLFFQLLLKHKSAVTTLAVDRGAEMVYCGSSDGRLNFWEKGRRFRHWGVLGGGHRSPVLCLAVAGGLVFSGSADTTICVWKRDGVKHTFLTVLNGHGGPVKCLAVEEGDNISGKEKQCRVFSGGFDGCVKVWQVTQIS